MRAPSDRAQLAVLAGVVLVALIAVTAALWASPAGSVNGRTAPRQFHVAFQDLTPSLGTLFHPGVILGTASNGTRSLLAGIGVYNKVTTFDLPVVAASVGPGPIGSAWENLTPALNDAFWEGGVYSAAWNGSSWLLGGQAAWGGNDRGAAELLSDGRLTNLTPEIGPIFAGGGIFAVGWNGTAWLLGGNSSSTIALAALEGGRLTNLTSELPGHLASGWVQMTQWNGAEWMITGTGVVATLTGAVFHDLDPSSPFLGNGAYAAAWNGSAWLVGGGDGARLVVVQHDRVAPGPAMPTGFDQVVLFVAPLDGGWAIGGKGTTPAGVVAPEFVTWNGTANGGVTDDSSLVPSSFGNSGEIQAGAPLAAPVSVGSSEFLLVGDGNYNFSTGYGTGAVALVTVTAA